MNNEYIIDLKEAKSKEELHERIQRALPLPNWYGGNLDALYDVLTDPEFGEECEISFVGCRDLQDAMPKYYAALQRMCADACREKEGLIIRFYEE